jgi:4-hydroxy-3-polyprenylbenzoate decarboxylase
MKGLPIMDKPVSIQTKKRLIVGMSGASGVTLGIRLLEIMKEQAGWETHLVMTRGAEISIAHETDYTAGQVMKLADIVHEIDDIGDSIASGSFRTEGMIILPCSMKTAAGIACGYSDNLLLRAADVTLKERRTLVIAARENPLSTIHLRNLLTLSEAGAYIMPPMISCYNKPQSLEDMNLQILGKLLDRFGIETEGYRRWE